MCLEPSGAQRAEQRHAVQLGDAVIGDQRVRVCRAALGEDARQLRDEAAADQNVVRGIAHFAERDVDRYHATSGTPERLLAKRASTNSRSESRLR